MLNFQRRKQREIVTILREYSDNEEMSSYTNGGSQTYTQVAIINMLPLKVHFKPSFMANIRSIQDITSIKCAIVIMDSSKSRHHYHLRLVQEIRIQAVLERHILL